MIDKQETEKKQVTTNIQLAGHVARDVELEAIVLKSAHLEAQSPEVDLTRMALKQQFRPRYEVLGTPSRLRVLIAFVFDLEVPEAPPRSALHLAAEYSVTYKLPEGKEYSAKELEYFAELNGALNVWPYWRELVHTVVARAGLGSITLPVFRAISRPVEVSEGGAAETKKVEK